MTRLARPSEEKQRLIVALDFATREEALGLVDRLGDSIEWVKVGLELFCSAGPAIVQDLADRGKRVFLDLKFHDIPTTVSRAVAAVSRLPVQLINLHAAAGKETMRAAQDALGDRTDLGLLAVTRLTSRAEGGTDYSDVIALAEETAQAGLYGVVCPAPAVPDLKRRFGERLAFICPGIRPTGTDSNDQVHIATPVGAVRSGADWIVVGRPVTQADDPAAAADQIVQQLRLRESV